MNRFSTIAPLRSQGRDNDRTASAGAKRLAPAVVGQNSLRLERRHDRPDRRPADPERASPGGFGTNVGADRIGVQAHKRPVMGPLEDSIGLHLATPSDSACL